MKTAFKPSIYQQEIFKAVTETTDNLCIEAVAGSGKTTTIVEALKLCKGSVLFVAFNKTIATELQARVPSGVQACTLNSFGWSVCRKSSGKKFINLDANKTSGIYWGEVLQVKPDDKDGKKYFAQTVGAVKKLVSLAKAHLYFNPTRAQWEELIEKYDIEIAVEDMERFFQNLHTTFKISCNTLHRMDFDDQIFMPLFHNWNIPKYDVVMVDESQDLNPAQIELVCKASGNEKL
jgi:superfamily I DNA/RNA helicase